MGLAWLLSLTWTCMVCGAERPDAQISVAYRPTREFPDRFPACRWNVRYCNDRPGCVAVAHAAGPWPWPPDRGRGRYSSGR